jgi:DNA-binding MltR family transcriptional regulator
MVLVGAVHVDECLARLFRAVFRPQLSQATIKRLLKYPGPLSSFAARIDVAYALRLIPKDIHDALNALRELRNSLAHERDAFSLAGNEDRYFKIYALGPNVPAGMRSVAFRAMFEQKITAAKRAVDELREQEPDLFKEPVSEEEVVRLLSADKEAMRHLERQLPHWELAFGIALLASMIIYHRDRAVAVLGDASLIGSLSNPKRPRRSRREPA